MSLQVRFALGADGWVLPSQKYVSKTATSFSTLGTKYVHWSSGPYPVPTSSTATAPEATPLPEPVLEDGGNADLDNLVTVPIIMAMSVSVDLDKLPDEQVEPLQEDWDSFLTALQKFLTEYLNRYYEEEGEDSGFVGLQNMVWVAKVQYPMRSFQYGGTFQFDIAFMEGSDVLSSRSYWNIINKFNFQTFVRRYLWVEPPADSFFHHATSTEWNWVS